MKKINIKSKKQENGLYGIPYNCYSILGAPPINDDKKNTLFSAIVTALDERYNTGFKISFLSKKSFFITIEQNQYSNQNTFLIHFDKYEYADNILYEFENDNEKTTFLRKYKLKELEKC